MTPWLDSFRWLTLACTLAFPVLGGCGDDSDGSGGSLQAHVVHTDKDGTQTFEFDASTAMDHQQSGSTDLWEIAAVDSGVFAVHLMLSPEQITKAGDYTTDTNLLDQHLQIWLGYPSPDKPGSERVSSTDGGTKVTFEELGYSAGDRVAGTFDRVLMDREADDGTPFTYEVTQGVFEAFVP
jgi:hypothetical protein